MNPIDYRFCDRTVTIYRKVQGDIRRLVAENCFFSRQTLQKEEVSGRRTHKPFLLIMPGQSQRVFPGDLVYDGVGPECTEIDWAKFVPAAVEELCQAEYVRPWFWEGCLAHVEAGRE